MMVSFIETWRDRLGVGMGVRGGIQLRKWSLRGPNRHPTGDTQKAVIISTGE